jgi:hypothetical protein
MTYTCPKNNYSNYGSTEDTWHLPSVSSVTFSCLLQELLWGNHRHLLFEASPSVTNRKPPRAYEETLDALLSGEARFFAPAPRFRKGNKKDDCAMQFDALWIDIDREPGVDPYELLAEIRTLLPEDLQPSAVVFSGNKGLHCYWKLDRLLSIEEVESWNKALAHAVGGDCCHDRTRILTHPGTPHRKTGRLVEIIDFTAEVHPVERLRQLPEIPKPATKVKPSDKRAEASGENGEWFIAAEALTGWGEIELPNPNRFMGIDWAYMARFHRKEWMRGDWSRSEVEASIVSRLVGEGASDHQIRKIADGYFSKHIEERPKRGCRYIDRTIRSARRDWFDKGWITHPLGGGRKRRKAKYRASSVADLEKYLELVHGQPLSEWVGEVRLMGKSKASAYRYKDGFERENLVEVAAGNIIRITNR